MKKTAQPKPKFPKGGIEKVNPIKKGIAELAHYTPKPSFPVMAVVPSQKELQVYVSDLPAKRKITSQKAYDLAMVDYKQIGAISKELKAKKDSVLNPLKLATKNLNAIFKPFEDEISRAEEDYKSVLNAWVQEQERLRIEALEKIEKDGRLSNPVTIQEKINAIGERQSGTFMVKVIKIVDPTLIPLEYFDLNNARVLEAYKAGVVVPGVEIVEEPRVRR